MCIKTVINARLKKLIAWQLLKIPKVRQSSKYNTLTGNKWQLMFCSINGIVQTVIFARTTRLCRSGQRRCCRKSAAKMRMIAAAAVAVDMMVDRLLPTAAPCCKVADLSTVTEVYLLHSNPRHTPRLRKAPQPLSIFFCFLCPWHPWDFSYTHYI